MLIWEKIQSQPPIHKSNIERILRERRAKRACERDGDFRQRYQRLDVDKREPANGDIHGKCCEA